MSNENISVIIERIDNLKEHFNDKFERIEKQLDGKCDNCVHVPTFRERLRSQFFHICALWSAIIGLGGGIVYVGILLFNHIAGK